MRKKRFSVEQIAAVLKQAKLDPLVADLIRQVGISGQTYLTLEEAVRGLRVGLGAGAQVGCRGEFLIQAAGGRIPVSDQSRSLVRPHVN
jgi:hypothetical protein